MTAVTVFLCYVSIHRNLCLKLQKVFYSVGRRIYQLCNFTATNYGELRHRTGKRLSLSLPSFYVDCLLLTHISTAESIVILKDRLSLPFLFLTRGKIANIAVHQKKNLFRW